MTKLNIYTTLSQEEKKAVTEARRAKIQAYVPREKRVYKTPSGKKVTRYVPTISGYVWAAGKPFDSKHIKENLGPSDRLEVRRFYKRNLSAAPSTGYAIGERIEIAKGHATVPATILKHIGGSHYEIGVEWMGKLCRMRLRLPTREP